MATLQELVSARPGSRSHSRASSRDSIRSFRDPSPSFSNDDPVSIRNHMSTLKHTIRHQQAQLHTLESVLQRSSLPTLGSNKITANSPSSSSRDFASSPLPSSYIGLGHTSRAQRRNSSFEVLQGLAGPESFLPLPKKDVGPIRSDDIQEGVPADFAASLTSSENHSRRSSSPTRTLSRIPVASVGHARTLAEDGQPARSPKSMSFDTQNGASHVPDTLMMSSSSLQLPPSPGRRMSFGASGGNTTKVLADLQAGVINAKNALENTKAQLRLSQRTVAQLTRQTEDLKDGRERLLLENEGLNNVVARKEHRARKSEAEAALLKAQLKSEAVNSKRVVREMETQVQQSTTVSQKSEREYVTLRDGIKHLSEGWKQDTAKLKKEMQEREAKLRKEAEDIGKKYQRLLEQIEKERKARSTVDQLRSEEERVRDEWTRAFRMQVDELRERILLSEQESTMAGKIAQDVSNQLLRLRSLIRAVGKEDSVD
ncbi:hypothetical protein EW145_g3458 [Phellinidium pouzarii]|uniref:SWI5-dependent HO expression protein 3 n=1 Tax=Phellinidium pouzarii TaxID=167371 RepID=A0A4S4L7J6_9AGAM|nr:hypothetical protein EW145_g3458 [Phellinidium pouzarii]